MAAAQLTWRSIGWSVLFLQPECFMPTSNCHEGLGISKNRNSPRYKEKLMIPGTACWEISPLPQNLRRIPFLASAVRTRTFAEVVAAAAAASDSSDEGEDYEDEWGWMHEEDDSEYEVPEDEATDALHFTNDQSDIIEDSDDEILESSEDEENQASFGPEDEIEINLATAMVEYVGASSLQVPRLARQVVRIYREAGLGPSGRSHDYPSAFILAPQEHKKADTTPATAVSFEEYLLCNHMSL